VIYLYAVTDVRPELAGLHGVGGETVSALTIAGFVLVCGEVNAVPELSAQTLGVQDQLVRYLHNHVSALLPMRFGSAFASRADVDRVIDLQSVSLKERLNQVRHREQMTIRLFGPAPPASTAASGADYLRQRARPAELAPWLDVVEPVVRATTIERSRTPGLIATVYHLIDRGAGENYRERVHRVHAPGLSAHISGPSPCYAFASTI
jgi:hypothetical protein